MDLVLRLRQEMRNRSSYDKVFQKVWGASGRITFEKYFSPCNVQHRVLLSILFLFKTA